MLEYWEERFREAESRKKIYRIFRETSIPSCEELIKAAGREYRRAAGGARGWREVEARRLQAIYRLVKLRLGRLLQLPRPEEMNIFHRELIDASIGLENYAKALDRVKKALYLAHRFYADYIVLVTTSRNRREAARYRREGCGRILSLVRRLCRHLELLRRARSEVLEAHIAAEGLPVVVVAGAPNAGKSTLVARLSTAEPEVASYPFTTKKIIVGKVRPRDATRCTDYYLIDVPGLLDREPRNEAEKRAWVAIRTLADAYIYMLDPSEEAVEPLERQIDLLRRIMSSAPNTPLIIAVNKIDVINEDRLNTVLEVARAECSRNPTCRGVAAISALKGSGVEELTALVEEIVAETLTARGRAP